MVDNAAVFLHFPITRYYSQVILFRYAVQCCSALLHSENESSVFGRQSLSDLGD